MIRLHVIRDNVYASNGVKVIGYEICIVAGVAVNKYFNIKNITVEGVSVKIIS